jgi:hypothetical protein
MASTTAGKKSNSKSNRLSAKQPASFRVGRVLAHQRGQVSPGPASCRNCFKLALFGPLYWWPGYAGAFGPLPQSWSFSRCHRPQPRRRRQPRSSSHHREKRG